MKVEAIFKPDKSKLGTLVAGTSGSGKTTAMVSMLRQAILNPKFPSTHRFVIIDPKVQTGDYDLLADPITDMNEVMKSIPENRVTLYWPDYKKFDQKTFEYDVSEIVDHMFDNQNQEPSMSFTFVLDESSILITPTQIPPSLKRLTVQGRAKNMIPIYISQRPLTNRWIDSNMSKLIMFRIVPVDADVLSKRWGLNFHKINDSITEVDYSFIVFDLSKVKTTRIKPVELPKKIPRPKKSKFEKMKETFGL